MFAVMCLCAWAGATLAIALIAHVFGGAACLGVCAVLALVACAKINNPLR